MIQYEPLVDIGLSVTIDRVITIISEESKIRTEYWLTFNFCKWGLKFVPYTKYRDMTEGDWIELEKFKLDLVD